MLAFQWFVNSTVISMLNVLFDHHSKVLPLPDDATASSDILFRDQMIAKISEMKNVLLILPGASMKYTPPL